MAAHTYSLNSGEEAHLGSNGVAVAVSGGDPTAEIEVNIVNTIDKDEVVRMLEKLIVVVKKLDFPAAVA